MLIFLLTIIILFEFVNGLNIVSEGGIVVLSIKRHTSLFYFCNAEENECIAPIVSPNPLPIFYGKNTTIQMYGFFYLEKNIWTSFSNEVIQIKIAFSKSGGNGTCDEHRVTELFASKSMTLYDTKLMLKETEQYVFVPFMALFDVTFPIFMKTYGAPYFQLCVKKTLESTKYSILFGTSTQDVKSTVPNSMDGTLEYASPFSWLRVALVNTRSRYIIPIMGVQIFIIIVMFLISGLFSGLTIGLLSLDLTELTLIQKSGTYFEKKYARAIAPLRKRGNFLLCSLVLGNVLVNSTLTVFLENLSSGKVAVIVSTIGITLFGEILPQAICTRHGLAIGAHTIWLTKMFMVITAPLSYPISLALDKILGEEIGAVYNRQRLLELVKLMAVNPESSISKINQVTTFPVLIDDVPNALISASPSQQAKINGALTTQVLVHSNTTCGTEQTDGGGKLIETGPVQRVIAKTNKYVKRGKTINVKKLTLDSQANDDDDDITAENEAPMLQSSTTPSLDSDDLTKVSINQQHPSSQDKYNSENSKTITNTTDSSLPTSVNGTRSRRLSLENIVNKTSLLLRAKNKFINQARKASHPLPLVQLSGSDFTKNNKMHKHAQTRSQSLIPQLISSAESTNSSHNNNVKFGKSSDKKHGARGGNKKIPNNPLTNNTLKQNNNNNNTGLLRKDEVDIITGALFMSTKTVGQIMTPIEHMFALGYHSILDFQTIAAIVASGYTRIPVFEEPDKSHIVALLNFKDLAFIDPDDKIPLATVLKFYNHVVTYVFEDTPLASILEEFKKGKSHMAFVRTIVTQPDKDPMYKIIGLVTLEDVIEEIIQSEIWDETDTFVKMDNKGRHVRKRAHNTIESFWKPTNLAKSSQRVISYLTPQMFLVAFQFLRANIPAFGNEHVSEAILKKLIRRPSVVVNHYDSTHHRRHNNHITHEKYNNPGKHHADTKDNNPMLVDDTGHSLEKSKKSENLATAELEPFQKDTDIFSIPNANSLGQSSPILKGWHDKNHNNYTLHVSKTNKPLYTKGKLADYFIMILEGRVRVFAGHENICFETGPFSYFGTQALATNKSLQTTGDGLKPGQFIPDYTVEPLMSDNDYTGFLLNEPNLTSCTNCDEQHSSGYSSKSLTNDRLIYIKIRADHYRAICRATVIERELNYGQKQTLDNQDMWDAQPNPSNQSEIGVKSSEQDNISNQNKALHNSDNVSYSGKATTEIAQLTNDMNHHTHQQLHVLLPQNCGHFQNDDIEHKILNGHNNTRKMDQSHDFTINVYPPETLAHNEPQNAGNLANTTPELPPDIEMVNGVMHETASDQFDPLDREHLIREYLSNSRSQSPDIINALNVETGKHIAQQFRDHT